MRARRMITAAVLAAATLSSTVAGLAITGTLDKASASSPVSPPVSGPGQNPGQMGQNPGQSGKGQNALSLADLDGNVSGTGTGLNVSVTNLDSNAAGAPGTETFQTDVSIQSVSIISCSESPFGICALASVSGTFTITTSVGTLSGTTSGLAEAPLVSVFPRPGLFGPGEAALSLTVTSATGEFKGATGTLVLEFPTVSTVEGTVTGG